MAYPLVSSGLAALTRQVISQNIPSDKIRKCWEPSSPTTQCNNIIKPFEESDKLCYICGMEIIKDVSFNSTKNNNNSSNYEAKDGLNPECEHILPIAEAIVYLGLESPQFRNNPWYMGKKILEYEYAWAHRTCNQIKSDTSFIVKDNSGKYVVDTPELKKLLSAIWNTTRKDSVKFKSSLHAMYSTPTNFIQSRTVQTNQSILPATDKFKVICNYLNSFGAPNLLFLAGICSISNINGQKSKFAREKQAALSPNYFQKLQEEKRNAKIAQATEDYTQIYNNTIALYKTKVSDSKYSNVYVEFGRLAQQEFEFYIHLVLQLSDELYPKWIEFTNISLKQLFIQAYKNIEGTNLPRVVSGLERNAYAQVLPQNVQAASSAPYSQGSIMGLAQWSPKTDPPKKLSLKGRAGQNLPEKRRQRREEKAIQLRKNKREQVIATKRRAQLTGSTNNPSNNNNNNNNRPANNNNNMGALGGRRKTRKNKKNNYL